MVELQRSSKVVDSRRKVFRCAVLALHLVRVAHVAIISLIQSWQSRGVQLYLKCAQSECVQVPNQFIGLKDHFHRHLYMGRI